MFKVDHIDSVVVLISYYYLVTLELIFANNNNYSIFFLTNAFIAIVDCAQRFLKTIVEVAKIDRKVLCVWFV